MVTSCFIIRDHVAGLETAAKNSSSLSRSLSYNPAMAKKEYTTINRGNENF